MTDFINSDFMKLLSILLAIVALFYIGVKNKPTNGMSKNIHVWYICGIATFVIVELITFIVVGNADAQNIMDNISFASTLSSLILSVLAIFMTVLSGESMNKLRDNITGLSSIPNEVRGAIDKTIERMQKSTSELNSAAETNKKNMEMLNDVLSNKIEEFEQHILERLNAHQQTTLKAINDNLIAKNKVVQDGSNNVSQEVIDHFLSSTSYASLCLLFTIDQYCKKINPQQLEPPLVSLKDLAEVINGGKAEVSMGMYLFACLVLLSSFGLLHYESDENELSDVRFSSINSNLISGISDRIKDRKIPNAMQDIVQYVERLFSSDSNMVEENDDGAEVDKD